MADNAPQVTGMGGLAQAINPAGLTSENLTEYQKTLRDAMTSLQQRYENPNWFNVAAGFFKPQLGGFAASLGSASQALGENLEKQRQTELPLAQMKVELGRAGMLQQQKNAANALMTSHAAGSPYSLDEIGKAVQLDPGGPAEKAMREANAELTRLAGQKQTTVATNVAQAEAAATLPAELFKPIPTDLSNPEAAAISASALKDKLIATASQIPGVDVEQLKTQNVGSLQDLIYNYQVEQRNLSLESRTKAGQAVKDMDSELKNYAELRKAIDAPGVGKILNSNKGPGFISVITNYVANQNSENANNLYRMLAQVKQENPDDYRAFEILTKKLTENVVNGRAMMQNPSTGATTLLSSGSPSIANSQDAMRAMVDAHAHELSSAAQTALFAGKYRGETSDMVFDPNFGKLQTRLAKQRDEIIGNRPVSGTPKYYNIFSNYEDLTIPPSQNAVVNSPTPVTPSANPAAPQKRKPTAAELFNAARAHQ